MNYLRSALSTDDPTYNSKLYNSNLGQNILNLIGDGDVDVIPWDISYIYLNDLNYNPRPVIQSYSAYNYYLDKKNYEKYSSQFAPDFVLFSMQNIDERHPFIDESITKLALITGYKPIARDNHIILLKKRDKVLEFFEDNLVNKSGKSKLGEYVKLVKSASIQYMSTDIEYNLLGRVASLFFQPPSLYLLISFDDGTEMNFRAAKGIVNSEFIVNKYVDSIDAAELFFKFNGKYNKNVDKIMFWSTQSWGFNQKFKYDIKNIQVID